MEGRELPVGWVEVPIGDLCELRNGRAFKPAEWTDEGIPIVRIQNLNNWQAKFNHYQGEVDANHLLGGGELLFAWSGTPGTSFGAHIWAGGKAALNQHIFRVDFDEDSLQKGFFRYAINQKLNDLIDIAHGGVGLRHVTKGKFEQTEVFLPPLNEQRRLAAKLDTTLAAVDACRQRLDGVAAILKRFRQAVLSAATSGELTREWREERGESSWDTKALGECGAVTGGVTKNSSRNDMTLQKPYLRVANVYRNRLELDDIAVIGVTDSEYLKTVLRAGDLLIVEGNGSLQQVGRVAIWQDESLDCVHQNHLIRWRTYEMEPKWALYWLMSPVGRELLEERAQTSTGLHTLSVSKISGIPIAYPSLSEQKQVIHLVGVLFTLADQLEAKLTAARKVVDRLTPALLAKAFRGELVPQDPTDEPASVLMERIRAARQAEADAGKPSRRGRPKAAANPDQLPLDAAPVPPDFLAGLLRECGALSERALLAVSELEPQRFQQQLYRELESGTAREVQANGQVVLEAVR
jgi:type I restriction enzyme, S subunit